MQTECDAKLRRTAATAKATAPQSEEQSALQRTVQQLQGQLEERERQLAEAKASLRAAPVLHSRPPAVDAPEQVESNGSKVSLSSQAESSPEVTADVDLEELKVATAIPSHQESPDVETGSETLALDEPVITAEPSSAEKTIPSTAECKFVRYSFRSALLLLQTFSFCRERKRTCSSYQRQGSSQTSLCNR